MRDEPILEELIPRMAVGDRAAFAAFYDATSPFVFGLLLRLTGERSAAEEIAQDVYAQLWERADRFDPRRGVARTWIAMVARSRAIDRLRADASYRSAVDGFERETRAVAPADPETEAVVSERRARVRAALAELPAEQREAIELAFFGGLSHTAIAARCSLPLGTVKSRIRAAIGRLAESLRPALEGEPGGGEEGG